MAGITSLGAYIPSYRISRDIVAATWGSASAGGEIAVANYDEDSLTLGVESALNCIDGLDGSTIDGVFFASTTAPYTEKSSATLIATLCDLGEQVATTDFGSSLRGGTSALKLALDLVARDCYRSILVVAADRRRAQPGSPLEQRFGDGSAAVLIGNSKPIANIEGAFSLYREVFHFWKKDADQFVREAPKRFGNVHVYSEIMPLVLKGILAKYNLKPEDFAKVVICGAEFRYLGDVMRKAGFDPKKQLQNPMLDNVGDTGTAHPLLLIVSALEQASPGDKILMASYGDGGDAFVFTVTEEARNLKMRRGVEFHLEKKRPLSNYNKLLQIRGLIRKEE